MDIQDLDIDNDFDEVVEVFPSGKTEAQLIEECQKYNISKNEILSTYRVKTRVEPKNSEGEDIYILKLQAIGELIIYKSKDTGEFYCQRSFERLSAIVDLEDKHKVSDLKWSYNARDYYIQSNGINLHRIIMSELITDFANLYRVSEKDVDVHHSDSNKLDCRKQNLIVLLGNQHKGRDSLHSNLIEQIELKLFGTRVKNAKEKRFSLHERLKEVLQKEIIAKMSPECFSNPLTIEGNQAKLEAYEKRLKDYLEALN